jgi:ATP-dependent DNA helicase PIF1
MVALPPSRKAKQKLYVVLSRGVSRQTIRILAKPKKKLHPTGKSTKNIIYNNIMDR